MNARTVPSHHRRHRLRPIGAFVLIAAGVATGAAIGEPLAPLPSIVAWPALPEMIVDPPVLPGSPAHVVRGQRRPVVYYEQPARLSPPGEPAVLPPPIPHGDRQTTLVEAIPSRLVLATGSVDQRRFVSFLATASRGRLDALHLELRGRPSVMRMVVRAAVRAGVDPLKIRTAGHADRGAEVIASLYISMAPVCPSQAIIGPSVNDNDFEPTQGCSNRANLAAMLNDPRDLLGNGAIVPADGAYAARGVERYRNGDRRDGVDGGNRNGQADRPGGLSAPSPAGEGTGSALGAGGAIR